MSGRKLLPTGELDAKGIGSRTTLHRIRHTDPTFPDPIEVGGLLYWYEDEIDEWLAARPRRRNAARDLEAA